VGFIHVSYPFGSVKKVEAARRPSCCSRFLSNSPLWFILGFPHGPMSKSMWKSSSVLSSSSLLLLLLFLHPIEAFTSAPIIIMMFLGISSRVSAIC